MATKSWNLEKVRNSRKELKHLEKEFKLGRHDQKTHEIIIKNHKANNNLSQKKIAERLGIAGGKGNRLMKPDGPVDQYANKMLKAEPEDKKKIPSLYRWMSWIE